MYTKPLLFTAFFTIILTTIVELTEIQLSCNIDDGLQCKFFNVHLNGNSTIHFTPYGAKDGMFYPAEVIIHIEFIESQLERIPPELFLYYANAQEVVASGVNLQTLDATSFYGGKYLSHIDISENEIKVLEGDVFSNATSIQKLDISKNRIQYLDYRIFSDLYKLVYLDLSYNKINKLMDGIFQRQEQLEVLVVSDNNLVKLNTNTFKGLENLMYLSLENNHLKFIDIDTFKQLKNLQYLRLANNYLTSFDHPHNAQNLYLGYNSIKTITINPKLYILDVQSNEIIDIKCQSENSTIEILLINNNKLQNINCIETFHQLKILHAARNHIQFVSKIAFNNLINLELCNLNNNKIYRIDTMAFEKQKKLFFMDMSKNDLTELNLSKVFPVNNVIETLLLSDNKIEEFDVEITRKYMRHLKLIDLKGNPFNCSSSMWFNNVSSSEQDDGDFEKSGNFIVKCNEEDNEL